MNANNAQYISDRKYGLLNEEIMKPILSHFFNIELTKDEYRYAIFDFFNKEKKIKIELKSRKCNFTNETEPIISMSKICAGYNLINKGYRVFFVWKYGEIIPYYELKKSSIKKEWKGQIIRNRGYEEFENVVFIPNNEVLFIK